MYNFCKLYIIIAYFHILIQTTFFTNMCFSNLNTKSIQKSKLVLKQFVKCGYCMYIFGCLYYNKYNYVGI